MKRFLCFAIAFLSATLTFAQTGLEIVNRMNERINSRKADGLSVNVDVKVPIVGLVTTRTWILGDKRRLNVNMKGHDIITFNDGKTNWVYMSESNSLIITNDTISAKVAQTQNSKGSMDMDMFGDISGGYEVTIKSENMVKWELLCKKKKSNDDDDSPKKITLEVRKDSYDPISMSTKMMGITMTMSNFKFGITEKDVTFNVADFPDVNITDQRK
ncbi:MAG: hypothetical protein IKN61_09965 [Bacteroidaceae bacterium]|nr:hypothetical protein [Bacteroidaceae bacterium]